MAFDETFEAILGAAKAGADWAWERIYKDLAGPVTGYLKARGAPDAEDVAAETFLQVARNIRNFEGSEASFRSWVFVIAHRRLLDARRAAARRGDTVPLEPELDSVGGDTETEALERIIDPDLHRALEALTDDQRHVIALRVIAGLSVEETAQVVGKRTGAVKALQRRALAAMRRSLEAEGVSK
ncbi:MAG TPA: sigma-70 family RNA polymerase sigma factor [Acidimicrobiia bacterium]|nr:sigma-70 family RNA polymerase sigma factor [Acidimicrobiia bacterium]